MKIEIVEFYPIKVDQEAGLLRGSLHVYLIDWQTDLRGISVHRLKTQWKFYLPFGWSKNEDKQKEVRFPIISLTDGEKHRKMVANIRNQGKDYIIANFKDLL